MKKSHKYLYGLLGTVAGLLFCFAVIARVGLSHIDGDIERLPENLPHESELSDFNRLDVSGVWEVEIVKGDQWRVQTDTDNEDVKIQAYIRDNELVLRQKARKSFWNSIDFNISAKIEMPTLDKLDVDVSGATEITGQDSRYQELVLDSSGASEVDFEDVTVTTATIDMSGAANLILTMDGGDLTGDISGAGNIKYYGTVATQDIDTSGAANVRYAGVKK